MAYALSTCKRHRHIELLRPELGLWGGLLLIPSILFITSARFIEPLPAVRLPGAGRTAICTLGESADFGLSMDDAGRIYFHSNDSLTRIRLVERVARQQGIRLTLTQQKQLSTVPYVGLPARQLLCYINMPEAERRHVVQSGIPANELSLYLEEAKAQVAEQGRSWPHFTLRLDERLTFSQAKSIFTVLGQHGIHQFGLVVETE